MAGKFSRGQTTSEFVVVFATVIVVAITGIYLSDQILQSGNEGRINESKVYWALNAQPLVISDWNMVLINQTAPTSQTIYNLSLTISNPTSETFTITSMNLSPLGYDDVYYYDGTYIDAASSMSLKLYPQDKARIVIQKRSNSTPPRIGSSYEIYVNMTLSNRIAGQRQVGKIPIYGHYLGSVAGGAEYGGCAPSKIACGSTCCDSGTQMCSGGVCQQCATPTGVACNTSCCLDAQICADGLCCAAGQVNCGGVCTSGSCACTAPTNLSCNDACCNPSTQICNGGVCESCSSPTSVPCLLTCCNDGWTCNAGACVSNNSAPWLSGMSIAPDSPNVTSNLTCNVTAKDNQSTTITVYYYWMKNGVNQSGLAGSAAVSNNTNTTVSTLYYAGNTSAGEQWACAAKAYDGANYGALNSTENKTILSGPNSAPFITAYAIKPDSPTTSDNITCNVTAIDNQSSTLTVYYYWFKNGVNQTALANSATVANNTNTTVGTLYYAGNTSIGDNWACYIKAYDGANFSALNKTANVTVVAVPNTAPAISSMSLSPASPTTTDNITCNVTAIDNQSTSINVSYYWFKNGANQTAMAGSINVTNATSTLVSTLYYSGNLTVGDNWSCYAKAYDGTAYGALNNTNNVTVANSAPFITAMAIKPDSPLDSDTLMCNVTAIDNQSDSIRIYYYWYKNGVSNQSGFVNVTNGTNTNIANLSSSYLTVGDNWACYARAYDGTSYSALNNTNNVTITGLGNTEPWVLGMSIAPASPTSDDDLICNVTALDNQSTSITVYYYWMKNGVNQTGLAGSASVSNNTNTTVSTLYHVGNTSAGDKWACAAKAYDGAAYSALNSTVNVTITGANTAPWIHATSIAPASPTSSDNITCNVTARDNQSTSITVYYYWMKNGLNQTALAGSASVSNNTNTTVSTLYYAGNISVGENWACAVKAYDGAAYSALNSTANVTIVAPPNTAPWIVGMSIAPSSPTDAQNLTCNITARDNQTTTINVSYYWMKNGVNQTGLAGTTTVANNTNTTVSTLYYAGNTSAGENWACAVKVNDGDRFSALNSTANVTIASSNTAPWISGMSIAPAAPSTTSNITCNVTAVDNQTTTINVSYYWMKNGVNQTALAGTTTVSNDTNTTVSTLYYAGNTSAGENWACAAKADDGDKYGDLNSTNNVTITSSLACGVISVGGIYTMTENLSSPGATCFNITANGVTLDCAGYNISGDNTAGTFGVHTNASLTNIQNCHIGRFTNAIRADGANNLNLMQSNLSSAATVVYLYSSNQSIVAGNNISGGANTVRISRSNQGNWNSNSIRGSSIGLELNYSNNTLFSYGSVNTTSTYAAYLIYSMNNSLKNSIFSATIGAVTMYQASHNNLIDANYMVSSQPTATTGTVYFGTTISVGNNFTNNNINHSCIGTICGRPVYLQYATNHRFVGNNITSNAITSTTPAIQAGSTGGGGNIFVQNTIKAYVWVNDAKSVAPKNGYNDSSTGNVYYFPGGAGAWTVFDIRTTPNPAPGWAIAGAARPFSATTVAGNFSGTGTPSDAFPWTANP